jgi:hypothetical protein
MSTNTYDWLGCPALDTYISTKVATVPKTTRQANAAQVEVWVGRMNPLPSSEKKNMIEPVTAKPQGEGLVFG